MTVLKTEIKQEQSSANNGSLLEIEFKERIIDFCAYYGKEVTSVTFDWNGQLPTATMKGVKDPVVGLNNVIEQVINSPNSIEVIGAKGWAEFCQEKLQSTGQPSEMNQVLKELDFYTMKNVYLVGGDKPSASDVLIYLWTYNLIRQLSLREKEKHMNLCRWFDNIQRNPDLRGSRDIILFSRTRLFS